LKKSVYLAKLKNNLVKKRKTQKSRKKNVCFRKNSQILVQQLKRFLVLRLFQNSEKRDLKQSEFKNKNSLTTNFPRSQMKVKHSHPNSNDYEIYEDDRVSSSTYVCHFDIKVY